MLLDNVKLLKQFADSDDKKFLVPYDETGKRIPERRQDGNNKKVKKLMWLDLNPGSSIKVVNHNIKGADQPSQRHIREETPQGEIKRWNKATMAVELRVKRASMLLGFWWIKAAVEGRTPTIPVVNADQEFEERSTCYA